MKNKILFVLLLLLKGQLTYAQVLYSENFNNLTSGNVGTDDTGIVQGKGGWYTTSHTNPTPYTGNNDFKIIAEPGRGNVLQVTGPAVSGGRNLIALKNLGLLWNNRTAGNNVLKIEYDFFTGNTVFSSNSNSFWNQLGFVGGTVPLTIYYANLPNLIRVSCSTCTPPPHGVRDVFQNAAVPRSSWLKFELYLDYANQISYFTVPSLGVSGTSGWFSSSNFSETRLIVETIASVQPVYKFDNFVISAVDTVPLSTQDFISSKFNVFPNPINDVVTITNNESISIEQIQVFDISGKSVKTHSFTNVNEVQLNIENLASGSYLLQIKNNKVIAVKKIVKK